MDRTARKIIAAAAVAVLSTGCSAGGGSVLQPKTPEEQAEAIFEPFYKAVSGTVVATGHPEKFTWRGDQRPFPYKEASWSDFHNLCSGKARLRARTDTYPKKDGTGPRHPEYPQQVEKVKRYWESQGWKVHTAGGAAGYYEEIVTDVEPGFRLVYNAGQGGEAITAETNCSEVFNADQSKAKKIQGAGAHK